jgi:serine/threonine protein kinase
MFVQKVTPDEQKHIDREADILKRVRHPNIVVYKDFLSESIVMKHNLLMYCCLLRIFE